jgi:putative methyltransferase (TIGR04325 family)
MKIQIAIPHRLIKSLPLARRLVDRRYYAHFLSEKGYASFYGVFDSFSQVRKKVPASKGYNNRKLADEYVTVRMHRIFPYDYPFIHWLYSAFSQGAASVFDIGGSVGVHYHAYKKFVDYPAGLAWQVCETPEIVEVGREIVARLNVSNLSFTESLTPGDVKASIWISAGALQYIENGQLHRLIRDCQNRPQHIILNKLPVYDGEDFVVAQNIGEGCYSPCNVYNRRRLIEEMEQLGYQLIDTWDVLERALYLPGHPEKSFNCFTGMYFRTESKNKSLKNMADNHTREKLTRDLRPA